MIATGSKLPEFSLPNQDGQTVSNQQFLGAPLVVFFYPKDDTPGCTAEACAFRDHFEEFRGLSATIIGISSDGIESHKRFREKWNLPFDLLSDKEGRARKAFDVRGNLFGLIPGRATFIFDASGKLVHAFQSQLQAKKHISEALERLQK